MKKYMKIVSVIVFFTCFTFLGISGILYYSVMNQHVYTFQNAKGLPRFSDYDSLIRKESCCYSNQGNKLQGFFYSNVKVQGYKGIIIVNNGFGSGHEAMMGEIETLASHGFLVYGFDKTGYDDSEGEGIGSLTKGVKDLLSAISHVRISKEGKDLPIILYGKSWGAYCCLAVLKYTDDVSAVVSMSAFNKTSDMMEGEITRRFGDVGKIFVPFVKIFDAINEQNITALDGLANTDVKVLIMHSKDDTVVSMDSSYGLFQKACENRDNITFIPYIDKGHNIIKSARSIAYNQQMDNELQIFAAEHNNEMTDSLWDEFLSQYDLKLCTEPDAEVVKQILNGIDDVRYKSASR